MSSADSALSTQHSALPGRVTFIGAGPGAPDLISVRGMRRLAEADVVIYADSLVDGAICGYCRPDAEIHGSSSLALPEIVALMLGAARAGKRVARVHSGDPSIYGALHEQLAALERAGVPYEIVPGVSSVFAAAAAVGAELTVPDVAQTVVFTRVPTRTTVPAGERLRDLAAGGTLCLFLSVTAAARIVEELRAAGWPENTPVVVAHRVTWPDELILRGELAGLAEMIRSAGLTKQALILIGRALDPEIRRVAAEQRSHLYHEGYSHSFRSTTLPKAQRLRGAKRGKRDGPHPPAPSPARRGGVGGVLASMPPPLRAGEGAGG